MQQGMSLQNIIDQVSKEKGIDAAVLVETMEQAILTAAKRTFGSNASSRPVSTTRTGHVDLYQFMTVVEDVDDRGARDLHRGRAPLWLRGRGDRRGPRLPDLLPAGGRRRGARSRTSSSATCSGLQQHRQGFGRIAAQTAKQVIIQRVRDAERELIFNEFKDRKGELITGIVRRFERGSNIIVDLGRTEASSPRASRRRARATARATASWPIARTSTARRAAPRSSSRAPTSASS